MLPPTSGRGSPAAKASRIVVTSLPERSPRALADWAVSDIGLHRLEIRQSTANAESCQVALRARFNLEGTARRALLHADGWHDMHVHARLATKG